MKKLMSVVFVMVFFLAFASGCAVDNGFDVEEIGDETGDDEERALDADETVSIQITGSDSEVNLVQRMAEEFMDDNPGVRISVTGGGSGVGINALIDGNCDIANSSRPMKDEETESVRAAQGEAYAVRFAVDGVAVIVNEGNPIENIALEDLGAIFRGEINNWSELGGPDKDINLYGRQSTSGTYVFFMEKVLAGDYADTMMNMAGNADIVEAIRNDETGIGYVAIGYAVEGGASAPGLKVLNVSADSEQEAYSPIELENIIRGLYPITRPLYQFVVGKPTGAILDFFKFEVSDAGEAIVLSEGFYPITDEDREFNRAALE